MFCSVDCSRTRSLMVRGATASLSYQTMFKTLIAQVCKSGPSVVSRRRHCVCVYFVVSGYECIMYFKGGGGGRFCHS